MVTKTPARRRPAAKTAAAPAIPAKAEDAPIERDESLDLEITAEPKKKITVGLVGVVYEIRKPKTALLMKMALTAKNKQKDPVVLYHLMEEVLEKAFGKETAAQIQGRLEDSDDDLEYEHITQLVTRLMQHGTGNPSTSS